jgi:hypothetical protein
MEVLGVLTLDAWAFVGSPMLAAILLNELHALKFLAQSLVPLLPAYA